MTQDAPPPTWQAPDGTPIACVEKIKVMNENLTELAQMALDLLEDGLLMGCDEAQMRQVLHAMVDNLSTDIRS